MRKVPAVAAAGLLLAGCVLSIETAIPDRSLVLRPELLGTWANGEERAVITQDDSTYVVLYTDAHRRSGRFEGRLGLLGNRVVLEVTPRPDSLEVRDPYRSVLIPGHHLFVLRFARDTIESRSLSRDSVEQVLRSGVVRVPALIDPQGYGDYVILTGDTAALQRSYGLLLSRRGALATDCCTWRRVTGP